MDYRNSEKKANHLSKIPRGNTSGNYSVLYPFTPGSLNHDHREKRVVLYNGRISKLVRFIGDSSHEFNRNSMDSKGKVVPRGNSILSPSNSCIDVTPFSYRQPQAITPRYISVRFSNARKGGAAIE